MKKNQLWINTRVELQWDADTQQYKEVSVEGYWADVKSVAYAHASPSIDQDTYAWYNDGTQSGSTIIGTANNSQSLDADTTYLVRFVIQEVNGGSSNNFSFQLQYDVNNSGTFNNVTSTSNNVRATVSSNLGTDGSNTTQRLGSGTFISTNAGVDNGDGVAGTASFAGNDETEVVYSIQLRSADLSNGDTVQLRVAGCNTYTNTANATASVPNNVTVSLTGQSLTATGGTLTIARNFKKNISTTGQNLTATGGTLTVSQTSPIEITLTGEAVALTAGSTNITREKNITLTGTNIAVSEGTTAIFLDRHITLSSLAVPLSSGTLTITTTTNYAIDPIAQSVNVSGGSLSIERNFRKDIAVTGEAVALSGGSVVVTASQNAVINLTGDALSATGGTLNVNASKQIDVAGEAVAVSGGTLTVDRNFQINLAGETVGLSEGTLVIDAGAGKVINLASATITVATGSIRYTTTRRARINNGNTPVTIPARSFDQLYANGSDWFTY